MPKLLTADHVSDYRRDGFHFPVRVLPAAEARAYRDRLEAQERALGGPLTGDMRHKVHLLFTWANELARHPRILDAVEDVIGPDILCWSTTFFTKEARSPSFVPLPPSLSRLKSAYGIMTYSACPPIQPPMST